MSLTDRIGTRDVEVFARDGASFFVGQRVAVPLYAATGRIVTIMRGGIVGQSNGYAIIEPDDDGQSFAVSANHLRAV